MNNRSIIASSLALTILVVWVVVAYWVCGGIMRESDQAVLLDGAWVLAQDTSAHPAFHNYSGQFGSYWFLALLQRLMPPESLAAYVSWGNYVATSILISGVMAYGVSLLRSFQCSLVQLTLVAISLTTPTVLLSAPLLSSNIMAGGVLLWLVALRGWWSSSSILGLSVGAVLVYCAVALRMDSAFLLPLLCLLPLRRLEIRELMSRRYLWVFLISAVAAVLCGKWIAPVRYMPSLVLDWRLIGCYGLFGLLGTGLVLLWGSIVGAARARDGIMRLVIIGAVLLPVAMYALLLYSPRHLFMAGLVPLLLSVGAWQQWSEPERRNRWTQGLLGVGLAVNGLWLIMGPQVQSDARIRLSMTHATCYPTADGLWPFGCGAHFLSRLAKSDQLHTAIDHNQEIWSAWEQWNPQTDLSDYVISTEANGKAYVHLWGHFYGARSQYMDSASYIEQAVQEGKTKLTVATDREWSGTGKRQTSRMESLETSNDPLFGRENVVSTTAGRVLFMSPPVVKAVIDQAVYEERQALIEAHPGQEFILSARQIRNDGHSYVPSQINESCYYKTNYPEIFLKWF